MPRSSAPLRALLVASTGGHLKELHELRPRLGLDDVTWLTFDDDQSRSLLAGESVHYLAWTGSRDYANTVRNAWQARRLLPTRDQAGRDPMVVVSTGAALALSVLPLASARGLPCHYVESATRTTGPSMTGRVLRAVPKVHLYTQYPGWADHRWQHSGSVLDGYSAGPEQPADLRKVVVTLGTMRQWSFRSAVERVLELLPPTVEVVWQTGHTDVSGLPIAATPLLPAAELARHMLEADLVIAHAGVGSALGALESGHRPVLLPRRASRREHVDDHQDLIAAELGRRGLAVVAEAPELTYQDLLDAATRAAVRVPAPAFLLRDLPVRHR